MGLGFVLGVLRRTGLVDAVGLQMTDAQGNPESRFYSATAHVTPSPVARPADPAVSIARGMCAQQVLSEALGDVVESLVLTFPEPKDEGNGHLKVFVFGMGELP